MREQELQWLKDHEDEVEKLRGRWIAIEGGALVAKGDSFEAVYQATKEKGIEIPFIFLVPPKEDVVFVGF
jgi:hypothetical protein